LGIEAASRPARRLLEVAGALFLLDGRDTVADLDSVS
jgi:hypothetical protein